MYLSLQQSVEKKDIMLSQKIWYWLNVESDETLSSSKCYFENLPSLL